MDHLEVSHPLGKGHRPLSKGSGPPSKASCPLGGGGWPRGPFSNRNWPKCNHYICDYMQLHLDIFVIIFCIGHICNYTTTNLQLLWFSLKENS
jgi:hypothetical protein